VHGCLWLDSVGGVWCRISPANSRTVRHVDFAIIDAVDMCGAALHARYSRESDIPVFDKSDIFSHLLQWLAAGTKVRPRYKRKFELSEFDITRFNCSSKMTGTRKRMNKRALNKERRQVTNTHGEYSEVHVK